MAWSRLVTERNDLVGTAEAARILAKSHRTIHRLVESGALVPALTAPGGFRGAFLFNRSDIDRIRDEQAAA